MKKAILLFAILSLSACKTQRIVKDSSNYNYTYQQHGRSHLIGLASEEKLKTDSNFSSWYNANYAKYQTSNSEIDYLSKHLKHYTIEIFMGTWCGDSKRGVPQIYKVLNASKFDQSDLDLYTVNSHKKSRLGEEAGKNIRRVPTVILYKKGQEVGRIIETPIESWEKDMVKIIKGEKYTPNYSR